jgi:rhamnosyltransferase subunit B
MSRFSPAPMHVLITPVGSAGDNYPFIGLGIELARRGHHVTVISNDHFGPLIERSGLEFVSVGTVEEFDQIIRDPEIWHPTRGLKKIMDAVAEQCRRLFDAVSQRIDDRTMIVAHTLDFSSRAMAEKDPTLPVVTVHLSPSIIRTNQGMGVLQGTQDLSFLPRWVKRVGWWLVDKWMIDPAAAPFVNEMRARLGLPPIKRVFERQLHSPLLTIGMWPGWFAPHQSDWPDFIKLTGFPLFDGGDGAQPVPPEVDAYLSASLPSSTPRAQRTYTGTTFSKQRSRPHKSSTAARCSSAGPAVNFPRRCRPTCDISLSRRSRRSCRAAPRWYIMAASARPQPALLVACRN